MHLDIERQLEDARKQFETQRDALADIGSRMGELTASASSPDESVTVTIGAQGDVTGIDFVGTAYRSMAPAELADLLVRTISDARSALLDEIVELLPESPFGGVSTADILRGEVDVADLLSTDLLDTDFAFPSAGGAGAARRAE